MSALTYFAFKPWSDLTKVEKWYNVGITVLTLVNVTVTAYAYYRADQKLLEVEAYNSALEEEVQSLRLVTEKDDASAIKHSWEA